MMRPGSGVVARTTAISEMNKCIQDLQQELVRARAEAQRSKDKLNCLISLIRRSWNGDRNAVIHLSNIIGMEPSGSFIQSGDGLQARPSSGVQDERRGRHMTRAESNWERLTVRLLQAENDALMEELHEYQNRYIENRSRYMDEVLMHHHQDMARVSSLSRPSYGKPSVEEVDQVFLQQHKIQRPLMHSKSAAHAQRKKGQRDIVQMADVKLQDLFVGPSGLPLAGGDGAHNTSNTSHAGFAGRESKAAVKKPCPRQTYDDSMRYVQGNLFNAEDMLTKKPRPVSAFVLREKDAERARPRSASTSKTDFFLTSAGEGRPLKYEAVHPVTKKKPLNTRKKSVDKTADQSLDKTADQSRTQAHTTPTFNTDHEFAPPSSPQQYVLPEETVDDIMREAQQSSKPPISVHVKGAVKRPESVDKFVDDLKKMEEMEQMFQRDTKSLQKKLGLPENGII